MGDKELLQSLLTIGAFFLFLLLFAFLLRRITRGSKADSLMYSLRVLSKLPLSNKTSLYLVQVGSKILLIGANENSITALADLTNQFVIPSNRGNPTFQNKTSQKSNFRTNPTQINFKEFLKETFKFQKNN